MKKVKKAIWDILVVVVPVMLGVYLGLLANNWNEARKEDQLTDKVLMNIMQEVERNRSLIEKSTQYFIQLRDTTFLRLHDKKYVNPSRFTFWQGLNPPILRSASFESASITGVLSNLDLGLLEQLSATYSLQEDIGYQAQTYISSVTNKIGTKDFDNERYLIILQNYAYDQVVSEEQLLEELDKLKSLLVNKIKNE